MVGLGDVGVFVGRGVGVLVGEDVGRGVAVGDGLGVAFGLVFFTFLACLALRAIERQSLSQERCAGVNTGSAVAIGAVSATALVVAAMSRATRRAGVMGLRSRGRREKRSGPGRAVGVEWGEDAGWGCDAGVDGGLFVRIRATCRRDTRRNA